MRSMHRFFILTLAASVLTLFAAGTALADYGVTGTGTAGIRNLSDETASGTTTNSTSQNSIVSEAIVEFKASAGPVSGRYRIESTETQNGGSATDDLNNSRHEVKWQVNDAFSIKFSGASFGFGPGVSMYGASSVGHLGSFGGPGDVAGITQLVFAINDSTSEFEFATGAMKVGLLFSGDYLLSSTVNSSTSAGTMTETMSVGPYFSGTFGPITIHAYLVNASGSRGTAPTTIDVSSSETSLGAIYKAGQLSAALQYVTGDIDLGANAGGTAATADTSAINLGVGFGPVGFHYLAWDQEETSTGVSPTANMVTDKTDIALAYTMPISEGASWSVGYGSQTSKALTATGVDTTDSTLTFSVRGGF